MKRFMNISVSIMCLVITLVIGIYIGGQLAQATEWIDRPIDQPSSQITGEVGGKEVPVEWLAYVVTSALADSRKVVKFSVTLPGKGGSESYLDPKEYYLYIEGFNPNTGRAGCLDRYPVWP